MVPCVYRSPSPFFCLALISWMDASGQFYSAVLFLQLVRFIPNVERFLDVQVLSLPNPFRSRELRSS